MNHTVENGIEAPPHSFQMALEAYPFRDPGLLATCMDMCNEPLSFGRFNAVHFTGSSVVLDQNRTHMLLTLHVKLGKWLQLGGHCDGIYDPFFVAWKEAYEESSLPLIRPITNKIFDIERHHIPQHNGVRAHEHMDIRYLFEADMSEQLYISEESADLRWVPITDLRTFNPEPSFAIIGEKLKEYKW